MTSRRDEAARLVFFYQGQGAGHAPSGADMETRFEPTGAGRRAKLDRGGWARVASETAMRSRNLKRWDWGISLAWRADWSFLGSQLRITDQPRL